MMTDRVVLGACLWLSGCAGSGCAGPTTPGDHYLVEIDTSTVADWQVAVVVAAVDDWAAHVPVTLDVTQTACSGHAPHTICVHAATQEETASHSPAYTSIGSTYYGDVEDGAEVWLDQDLVLSRFSQTATHELGHAMALEHTGAGSIMAPNEVEAAAHVTAVDVAQWLSLRGH